MFKTWCVPESVKRQKSLRIGLPTEEKINSELILKTAFKFHLHPPKGN